MVVSRSSTLQIWLKMLCAFPKIIILTNEPRCKVAILLEVVTCKTLTLYFDILSILAFVLFEILLVLSWNGGWHTDSVLPFHTIKNHMIAVRPCCSALLMRAALTISFSFPTTIEVYCSISHPELDLHNCNAIALESMWKKWRSYDGQMTFLTPHLFMWSQNWQYKIFDSTCCLSLVFLN